MNQPLRIAFFFNHVFFFGFCSPCFHLFGVFRHVKPHPPCLTYRRF